MPIKNTPFEQAEYDRRITKTRAAMAEAGAQAFPKSIGGQRCRNLVAALEQPQFSIRAMAFDSPGKRSIAVSHKGLDQLHFRAYAIDFERTLTTSRDYNLLPARREIEAILGRAAAEGGAGDRRA